MRRSARFACCRKMSSVGGQVFDKIAAAAAAPAVAAGEQKSDDKKPKAEDTNPILHRIQEAVLQVL